ncbi:S-layer homology domain-containing protein [Bifidobacterium miconisargentati]|uniref:S-layer homology domain-containing protein n=1 Tax=Bifidobacterium miconisargentati TaxID=2834437 RepID=UPI001BDD515D|nr:S-layer homology domain-containing protein [Bifidobacterium miconisargentati]MBW3091150.1 S-layer homology domain-containing protein [Bifidobacterium miconisargentati]
MTAPETTVVVSSADEVADWQKPTEDQPGDAKLFQGSWNGSGTASKPYTPATVAAATVKVRLAASNEKVYDQNGKDVTTDATSTGTDVAAGETVAALSVLNPAVQNSDGSYGVVVKWVDMAKNNEEFVFGADGTKVEKGRTYVLAKSGATDAVARAWHIFNAQSGDARQDFYVADGSNFDPSALKAAAERATTTGKYTFSGSWFSEDDLIEKNHGAPGEFAVSPDDTYGLTAFAADTVVSGNLTLVPAYTKNADEDLEYTFSFDPYYDGSAAATEVKAKGSDTIYDKIPTPTREGYKFVGWFGSETDAKAAENNSDAKNEATRADRQSWLKDETKTVSDFKSLFTTDSTTGDLKAKTYYAGWKLDQINAADFKNLVLLKNTDTYTTASFREYKSIRTDLLKTIKSETGIDFTGDTNEASVTAKAKKLTADDLLKYGKVLVDAKNNLVKVANIDTTFGQFGFSDVDVLTPHAKDIRAAAEQGFVKGYTDNTYRPSATILRQDFAAMLYRLAGSPAYTVNAADNKFSDVNESTPHYKEILWAAKNGIIKGYPDGTFGGTRTVVRQDAMAFLYRVSAYVDANSVKNVKVENTFADIATTAHATEVLWAANKGGIAKGYTDGNFHGLWNLTRADAAAFLTRTNDYLG